MSGWGCQTSKHQTPNSKPQTPNPITYIWGISPNLHVSMDLRAASRWISAVRFFVTQGVGVVKSSNISDQIFIWNPSQMQHLQVLQAVRKLPKMIGGSVRG
mmetsp:Transcript_14471/g.20215  ORF Transcript_14471/g.20215 Transcript_14471/m.20215 type:complete len:101 (+) Transcript_14471:250-552(+)